MFNFFKKKAKDTEIVVLKINGMHCTSCALNIDSTLEEMDGVVSAQTSYPKQEVKIEFDGKKVNQEAFVAAIEESGYTVTHS